MISILQSGECFEMLKNDILIGKISISENSFHSRNIYLDLDFDFLLSDEKDCSELFTKLFSILKRPMQVMIYSDREDVCNMLINGGFEVKRRCFEAEVKSEDYIGKFIESDLSDAKNGEEIYLNFANKYYEHYLKLHQPINPFSAGYVSFCSKLPEMIYYDDSGNFAFVEENEIAYVYGENVTFIPFAEKLISKLFRKYKTISFESDDNDNAAMLLKSLFKEQKNPSYDTYVYYGIDKL